MNLIAQVVESAVFDSQHRRCSIIVTVTMNRIVFSNWGRYRYFREDFRQLVLQIPTL